MAVHVENSKYAVYALVNEKPRLLKDNFPSRKAAENWSKTVNENTTVSEYMNVNF